MNENFKAITEALIQQGFHELTDKKAEQGKPLDFKITAYSLNTPLSFKFDSLDHFIEFLKMHDVNGPEQKFAALVTTFNELSLDPAQFFYVNFFEKTPATNS